MKRHFLLYTKGIAMGMADVVPGVSGGTIAFISGIYDQLLQALAAIPRALRLLLQGQLKTAWQSAQANFLVVLFAGVLTSVFSFAKLISYLLDTYPIFIWSFFFGLVLISVYLIAREVREKIKVSSIFLFALGSILAYWVTQAPPIAVDQGYLSLFFAGYIAICAMLLPGISGSFVLVLLGLYPVVLSAIKNLEVGILLVFISGCVLGLMSFSRVLIWMLNRWHDAVLMFLTGLMLGSLNKIWPWKETLSWQEISGEKVPLLQQNLWPDHYTALTGQDALLIWAIMLALIGAALVLVLDYLASRKA